MNTSITDMTPLTAERFVQAVASLEIRAEEALPPGICGRVRGVALPYDIEDSHGTTFSRGCLTRTAAEKVPAGKVKLYSDHVPFTTTHVGVVRKLFDDENRAYFEADIFDTAAGRALKEYLVAVTASGAHTGASIGFKRRKTDYSTRADGSRALRFTEVELKEISITPSPSFSSADVISVRNDQSVDALTPEEISALREIIAANSVRHSVESNEEQLGDERSAAPSEEESPSSDSADTQSTEPSVQYMSMEDRIAAVRQSILL